MIDVNGMVDIVLGQFPEQKNALEESTDQDGILGHIFANYAISQPMMELYYSDREKYAEYCALVEKLWKDGNDAVRNIVDVTILEDLNNADDIAIWKGIGEFISDEFKEYINKDLVHTNPLMRIVEVD